MPAFEIVVDSQVEQTFRVKSVLDEYELHLDKVRERLVGDIAIPEEWNVGVIYGASGTGKSTIARNLFSEGYVDSHSYGNAAVIDEMPKSATLEEITGMFNSVGFATVWSWLKPYSVLSTGEKMRVDLARALLSGRNLIVFDEYTSVVNREVARFASFAVQKAVRKRGVKFIAVTCHNDVLDWLEPDWLFCTDTMEYEYARGRLQRRKIELRVEKVHRSAWDIFRKHHYLNTDLNKTSECYCAMVADTPVAFFAVLHFAHPKHKKTKRGHRLVVLPDYQGCGIGHALSTHIADKYKRDGYRFIITSSTKSLLKQRIRDERWLVKSVQRAKSGSDHASTGLGACRSSKRYTYSYEYIGERAPRGL